MPDHPQFTFHKTQSQTPLPLLSLHVSQNKGQSDRSTTLNRRLMGKHTTKTAKSGRGGQDLQDVPHTSPLVYQQPLPIFVLLICAPHESPPRQPRMTPHPSSLSTSGPIPGPGPTAALLRPRSPIAPRPSPGSARAPTARTSHASSPHTLVLRTAPRGRSPSPRPPRCAPRPGSPSPGHSAPARAPHSFTPRSPAPGLPPPGPHPAAPARPAPGLPRRAPSTRGAARGRGRSHLPPGTCWRPCPRAGRVRGADRSRRRRRLQVPDPLENGGWKSGRRGRGAGELKGPRRRTGRERGGGRGGGGPAEGARPRQRRRRRGKKEGGEGARAARPRRVRAALRPARGGTGRDGSERG